jgi:hypothetical protein
MELKPKSVNNATALHKTDQAEQVAPEESGLQ